MWNPDWFVQPYSISIHTTFNFTEDSICGLLPSGIFTGKDVNTLSLLKCLLNPYLLTLKGERTNEIARDYTLYDDRVHIRVI